MEQTQKRKFGATKIALTIASLILVAILSVLVQQLLFGKTNVAISSAVVSVFTVTFWRLLRRGTR